MPNPPFANPLTPVDVVIDTDIDLTATSDLSYDNRQFNSSAPIRALMVNKSNPALNGIYTSNAGVSAWTRAADANTYASLVGASVECLSGDVYGPRGDFDGSVWYQKNQESGGVIDTDAIEFVSCATFITGSTDFASVGRIFGRGTQTQFIIAHPHNTQLTTPTFTTMDGELLYPVVVKVGFMLYVTFSSAPGDGSFVMVGITSPVIDFN